MKQSILSIKVREATVGCVAADCKSALFRVTSLVRFQPRTPIL